MINFHGNELTSIRQLSMYRIIITVLLFGSSFIAPSALAQEKNPPPPERAAQEASAKGFSTWDLQALYGRRFREPFVEDDVEKLTLTLENSSGWSWGSSYFFIDYLKSDVLGLINTIRSDNPSDIIVLDNNDKLLGDVKWSTDSPGRKQASTLWGPPSFFFFRMTVPSPAGSFFSSGTVIRVA
jgi:hypothetical protein